MFLIFLNLSVRLSVINLVLMFMTGVGASFNDLISHLYLANSSFLSLMMQLVCTLPDCFCIFGFPVEFFNVVVNL